jgi:hypothetical protein
MLQIIDSADDVIALKVSDKITGYDLEPSQLARRASAGAGDNNRPRRGETGWRRRSCARPLTPMLKTGRSARRAPRKSLQKPA